MSDNGSMHHFDDFDALDFDDFDAMFNNMPTGTENMNRLASLLGSSTTNSQPLQANNSDARNFLKSYKLFLSIASVDGLPRNFSCIAPILQSYFVDVEICKTTKKFELPVSKRKRSRKDSKELTEKNIQSNIWNFADYHGIMEIKFTVISQSLYFKSVICSKTIYISDLYDTQFGSGHVHSNAGWLQDCEILIPIKQQKPRKSWRRSTASELPLPQPFIFESISNTTSMSEFHFLCSCAPAAVVLEVMKGLAEVKLLPRCLQLRTQPRLGKAGEGEGGDLTYTPLDVALLCCNTPVVYDILRRAGSSCFQHLPTNKSNALHNAVRGGRDAMVELLLQYHVQVGAVNPKDNYTPLIVSTAKLSTWQPPRVIPQSYSRC
eukprot:gene29849-39010_t